MRKFLIIAALLLGFMPMAAQKTKTMTDSDNGDTIVVIKTTMGDIKVRLFGDTPRHRDNFLKHVADGTYNGVLFHRVINNFMIQGGDPESKDAEAGTMLGSGDLGYTLEAEIDYPHHFHKRGALAAARQGDNVNPERRSSASQFYIVTGKTYNDSTLTQLERRMDMERKQSIFNRLQMENRDSIMAMRRNRDHEALEKFRLELIDKTEAEAAKNPSALTEEVREAYRSVGGTPHLDGAYTVFGEVIDGMDVVDAIQKVETDHADRPVEDVRIISMTVGK